MRGALTIAISFILAFPIQTHASESLIKNVENFYLGFDSSMNAGDRETTLSLIEKHVAEDFGHYDDGVRTYGKTEFKEIVKVAQNMKVEINLLDVRHSEENNEILADFIITQHYFENKTSIHTMSLKCHDSLRILDETNFELYKCDCTTLK